MTSDPKLQVSSNLHSPSKRKTSASYRRQTSETQSYLTTSVHLQQTSQTAPNSLNTYDLRDYKLLLYVFSTNINTYYGKGYKSILGELQDYYKVPLTKQQKYSAEENTENLLERNINKLCRDILLRNGNILKVINEYTQNYKRYTNLNNNGMENSGGSQCFENLQSMTIELVDCREETKKRKNSLNNYQYNNPNPTNSQRKQLIKQRPHSSSRNIYPKSQQIYPTTPSGTIFKNKNMFLSTQMSNKNISRSTIILNNEVEYNNINTENIACEVYVREKGYDKLSKNKYKNYNGNLSLVGSSKNNINLNLDIKVKNIEMGNKKGQLLKKQPYGEVETSNENYHQNINETDPDNDSGHGNRNFLLDNTNNMNTDQIIGMYQYDYDKQKQKNKKINLFGTFYRNTPSKIQYNQYNSRENIAKNNVHKFFNSVTPQSHSLPHQSQSVHQYHRSTFNYTHTYQIKSIDQQSLQKIQSRIFSMSGTPSTNLTKPQGYKPKSKCWGNPVISTGKLNSKSSNIGLIGNGNVKNIFSMLRYKP